MVMQMCSCYIYNLALLEDPSGTDMTIFLLFL